MDWYVLLLLDSLLDTFSGGAWPGLWHPGRSDVVILFTLEVRLWRGLLRLWLSSSYCRRFLAFDFWLSVVWLTELYE